MRTAFFGTPAIAVSALRALNETTDVAGVVCQPDRPKGRGMRLSPGAVKRAALELGLEVHQPLEVRTGTLHEWLTERRVEAAVVMAYGRILPAPALKAPRWGCLNLHASLLPRYRGAAPIQWCLWNGETESGISLMKMDEGLDTGPVYCERRVPIAFDMTAGQLAGQLADLAAVVVREDLPRVFDGLAPTPQDGHCATQAPPIRAEHCVIDWRSAASAIVNQIRALNPHPGAVSELGGKRFKIWRAEAHPSAGSGSTAPGTLLVCEGDTILVRCGQGAVQLLEAQLEGKRAMPARDLINGRALTTGIVLGAPE